MLFGLILVVIGVLLLMQTFGWIAGNFWDFLWPVVIILVGISILAKHKGCSWCGPRYSKKDCKEHPNVVDQK